MLKSKITTLYEKHDGSRICQGDICRDFSFNFISPTKEVIELLLPYIVILTQDCDLEHGLKLPVSGNYSPNQGNDKKEFNQLLPNILFAAAFPSDLAKEGTHLTELYNIKQERIRSDRWKVVRQNKNERYHFLFAYQDLQIPDLLVDFKLYYTIPSDVFIEKYKNVYLATVNELFREQLSQRFAYYINRIGTPNIGNLINEVDFQ